MSPIDEAIEKSYTPELAHTMSNYWASFVKTGRPLGELAWESYNGNIKIAKQLHITTTEEGKPRLSVKAGLDDSKCDFFRKFIHVSAANDDTYTMFCNSPVPISHDLSARAIVV